MNVVGSSPCPCMVYGMSSVGQFVLRNWNLAQVESLMRNAGLAPAEVSTGDLWLLAYGATILLSCGKLNGVEVA